MVNRTGSEFCRDRRHSRLSVWRVMRSVQIPWCSFITEFLFAMSVLCQCLPASCQSVCQHYTYVNIRELIVSLQCHVFRCRVWQCGVEWDTKITESHPFLPVVGFHDGHSSIDGCFVVFAPCVKGLFWCFRVAYCLHYQGDRLGKGEY
jgi:hypothetical protein